MPAAQIAIVDHVSIRIKTHCTPKATGIVDLEVDESKLVNLQA